MEIQELFVYFSQGVGFGFLIYTILYLIGFGIYKALSLLNIKI